MIIGCIHHPIATLLRKEQELKKYENNTVIDLCLDTDLSVDVVDKTARRVRLSLDVLALDPVSTRYIHVYCDGSAHALALVGQFQRDYGIHACAINLNMLWDPKTGPSLKTTPVRVVDDRKHVFFSTTYDTAVRSIVSTVCDPSIRNTVHIRDSDVPYTPASFAAHRGATHLKFDDLPNDILSTSELRRTWAERQTH